MSGFRLTSYASLDGTLQPLLQRHRGSWRWSSIEKISFLWDVPPSSAKPLWSNSWNLRGATTFSCTTASINWKNTAVLLNDWVCDRRLKLLPADRSRSKVAPILATRRCDASR
jgi:hypothetical protein